MKVNFDLWERSSLQYDGTSQIISLKNNGKHYLLKLQDKNLNPKNVETSYRNNVVSEYIACKIIDVIGYPVQKVIYGDIEINGKRRDAVACEDFTSSSEILYEFRKIKSPNIDEQIDDPMNSLEINNILRNIDLLKMYYVDTESLKKHFWNQFVLDAFIGNFDRHNGNWGYILDKNNMLTRIAPIYDCGSSFFNKYSDETIHMLNNDDKKIKNIAINQSFSILTVNDKKIFYNEFFSNCSNKYFYNAFEYIYNKIDMKKINDLLESEKENISNFKIDFIKKILNYKFNDIFKPLHKKLIVQNFNLLKKQVNELVM